MATKAAIPSRTRNGTRREDIRLDEHAWTEIRIVSLMKHAVGHGTELGA